MAEELKACRYRVEKTGYGFWPFCVRAGDGTRELFKGHQKQCMVVAAELETAFEDGKFVADRAQASQGGEAVAIVCGSQVQWLPGAGKVPDRSPLYTHPADQVAGPANQIAWKRRDGVMGCKRFMTQKCYDAQSPQMKGNYEPFYCAHCVAGQLAEPDAELVACLKFARTTMAVVADNANLRGVEYRSLIAEIKRIDAKLASLKGVEE